jgi:Trypsin
MKEFLMYIGAQNVSADVEDGRLVISSTVSRLHPKYKNDIFANDIALIKLPQKVEMSRFCLFLPCRFSEFIFFHAGNFINFIRLPKRSELEKNYVGERTVVSGWGLTKDSNYIISLKQNLYISAFSSL